MNCYTQYGSKFYCLNSFDEKLNNYLVLNSLYDSLRDPNYIFSLFCTFDKSTNPIHKLDGPAVEWSNGDKYWYFEGKLHREDGLAVEGMFRGKAWFYHGKQIHCKDNEEFLKIISMKAFL